MIGGLDDVSFSFLVGGLEQFLLFHILGIITTHWLIHIFQKGLKPPTSEHAISNQQIYQFQPVNIQFPTSKYAISSKFGRCFMFMFIFHGFKDLLDDDELFLESDEDMFLEAETLSQKISVHWVMNMQIYIYIHIEWYLIMHTYEHVWKQGQGFGVGKFAALPDGGFYIVSELSKRVGSFDQGPGRWSSQGWVLLNLGVSHTTRANL